MIVYPTLFSLLNSLAQGYIGRVGALVLNRNRTAAGLRSSLVKYSKAAIAE